MPASVTSAPTPASAPARILIVRLSALGDIVFTTSLLDALRLRFPDAHIAWLAQQGFSALLAEDPRLNEVLSVPREIFRSLPALWKLRRELRARRYDWVIDAQGLLKSRVLSFLAGGHQRIGFASKEPGGFLMHRLIEKGGDGRDIGSEYRFLADQLTGGQAGAPRLLVSAASRERVRKAMAERGLQAGFIAFCPFTTRPQKHWMEHYWPELAHKLAPFTSVPCVLFGGPGDQDAAGRIAAAMPAGHVNVVGQTQLADLAAWLEQAALVIGVDTGLTHIGIAVRRPVVTLFGSTLPYTQGADSPLTVMYDALPCAPCARNPTCGGAYTCMRGLTPERVAAAARALL